MGFSFPSDHSKTHNKPTDTKLITTKAFLITTKAPESTQGEKDLFDDHLGG
jgi:hypothetical protein